MKKFSHEKIFEITLDVVYISSMMYVFGFAINIVIQSY